MPGSEPPAPERSIGIAFYATTTPGAGGAIKERDEDFHVREISAYPLPDPSGAFVVLRVRSQGWEQHELAERLASRLGLSSHAIDWAGTKDRRAVAERLFSYRGELPGPVDLDGVEVVEAYRARSGLVLGHHFGNAFEIRVPFSGAADARARWEATHEALRSNGFVPNLFGPQRFGEVRPVTHDVGRAMVRGDASGAVEIYLTAMPDPNDGLGASARRAFAEHHDPRRALAEFPPQFRFERQILDHLARGNDAARALRALSRELRLLFVHAYQSLLFNRWLTMRNADGLGPGDVEVGDVLLRVARDGTVPGTLPIPVSTDNLPETTDLVARGRALVAAPLVGFETPVPDGRPGDRLRRLLEEEGISPADFRLARFPEVASKGSHRPIAIPVPPIAIAEREEPDRTAGAWFTFALPKGAYATVLLREFTKTGAVP